MKAKNVLAGVVIALASAGAAIGQPYGFGPGMMGGNGGGYGMGPGMAGGYGGYGMGPGMMFGTNGDAYLGLDLTPQQRKSVAAIQEQASTAMWQLMGSMHSQGYQMQGMFGAGPLDEAAARKAFQAMTETQKAMFELQLDARKKIDAVLTKEQREKLSRYWSAR